MEKSPADQPFPTTSLGVAGATVIVRMSGNKIKLWCCGGVYYSSDTCSKCGFKVPTPEEILELEKENEKEKEERELKKEKEKALKLVISLEEFITRKAPGKKVFSHAEFDAIYAEWKNSVKKTRFCSIKEML